MPQPQNVLRSQTATRPIVAQDGRQRGPSGSAIDEDDRHRAPGEPVAVARLEPARGDDDAVDPPLDEEVQVGLLTRRLERGVLDRTDDLGKVRVGNVGHHQADRSGRAELE